jgi:hypothetical protein
VVHAKAGAKVDNESRSAFQISNSTARRHAAMAFPGEAA